LPYDAMLKAFATARYTIMPIRLPFVTPLYHAAFLLLRHCRRHYAADDMIFRH